MNSKHNEFAESLRNIMRCEEKKRRDTQKSNVDCNEDSQSLQELLGAKYDELFGTVDEDD